MTLAEGPGDEPLLERRAGRVIVLDPAGRVLMIHAVDPADLDRGGFWITPGGGLDDHESMVEGTRRELWEEVGLRVDDLGSVVLRRVGEFPYGGRWIRQREEYFIVEVDAGFEPDPQHFEPIELAAIRGVEWLDPPQLASLDDPAYPVCLAELIAHFLAHGRPDPPWSETQTP